MMEEKTKFCYWCRNKGTYKAWFKTGSEKSPVKSYVIFCFHCDCGAKRKIRDEGIGLKSIKSKKTQKTQSPKGKSLKCPTCAKSAYKKLKGSEIDYECLVCGEIFWQESGEIAASI